MRNIAKYGTAALAIMALAGCWKSDTPLVAASDGAVVDIAGSWVRDGANNQGIIYDISRSDDGSYFADYMADVIDPETDDRSLVFLPIERDWYVMQQLKPDGSVDGYAISRLQDRNDDGAPDHIVNYDPPCEESALAVEGISADQRGDCIIETRDALVTAAKAMIAEIEADPDFEIHSEHSRLVVD